MSYTVAQIIDRVNTFQPFFATNIRFHGRAYNYACLLCDRVIQAPNEGEAASPAAVSYTTGTPRWAHPKCLSLVMNSQKMPINVKALCTLVTDKKRCNAARTVFNAAEQKKRAATRAEQKKRAVDQNDALVAELENVKNTDQTQENDDMIINPDLPTVHIDVLRAEIEKELREKIGEEINQDYGEQIQKAVDLITSLRAENAKLKTALQAQSVKLAAALGSQMLDENDSNPVIKKNLDADKPLTSDEKKAARLTKRQALQKAS